MTHSKMKSLLVVLFVAFISLAQALVVRREDFSHTTCSVNRGNNAASAQAGYQAVIQQVQSSPPLASHQCLYTISNGTYVSVCNGPVSGRAVTVEEARLGLDAIFSQCGSQENYNGAHYTNDLKFKIYGISGGPRFALPSSHNDSLDRRDIRAPGGCPNFGFDGTERRDCQTCEHKMDHECKAYCEVRRTGFVGMEEEAPQPWGQLVLEGNSLALGEGESETTTHGFDVGLGWEFIETITLNIGYSFSKATTKIRSQTLTGEVSKEYRSRWVYFPLLIETCGTAWRKEQLVPNPTIAALWICGGEAEELHNVCYTGMYEIDGVAQVAWAQRFEFANGTAVPLHLQSNSYRGMCGGDNNPDGDPELECSATIQEPEAPKEPEKVPQIPCMSPPTPDQFTNVVPYSEEECSQKMFQCHDWNNCHLEDHCRVEHTGCLARAARMANPCMEFPTPGQFMNVIPGSATECSQKAYRCHNWDNCEFEDHCREEMDRCLAAVTAQG